MSIYGHLNTAEVYLPDKTYSMKHLKHILCLLAITVISLSAQGQTATWKGLLNASPDKGSHIIEMTLEKYGLYQNGREVNTLYPSESNHNKGENWTISFNTKGKNTLAMEQKKTGEGYREISGTFNGNMINETTRKVKGVSQNSNNWLKILSYKSIGDGKFRILTVDNLNTYRYFIAKPYSLSTSIMETFLGL